MTIQEQIDEIKKELSGITGQLEKKINQLQKQVIIKGLDNKPTRYYPNGAYMDEPEKGIEYFFISPSGVYSYDWSAAPIDGEYLKYGNCFPTEELAEKELNSKKLTAKMYRDMREESINGDWVADWDAEIMEIFAPLINNNQFDLVDTSLLQPPHNFNYKNKTFIEDLKVLGWTEEELKIVWFNI